LHPWIIGAARRRHQPLVMRQPCADADCRTPLAPPLLVLTDALAHPKGCDLPDQRDG
jgi:hypothetical protein